MGNTSGDRLTIVVYLPASLDDVGALLALVADRWPTARINVAGPDGWLVELPPIDGSAP